MELKQLASQDNELPEHGKRKSAHKAKRPRVKLTGLETTHKQKSLRDDWERTLAKKTHNTDTEQLTSREIPFHSNLNEHVPKKHVDKPDPIWAPYEERPKPVEKIQTTATAIEDRPVESIAVPEPVTLDPSLAHEAHLRAQAVATIASEHALMSTPSYKEQLPKEAQDIIDQLRPAGGNHIEQSVWHNIEVDETGHAAKDTNFNYGEAFLNEQKAETNALFSSDEGTIAAASGQLAVGLPQLNNDSEGDSVLGSGRDTSNPQLDYQRGRYDTISTGQNNIEPLLWIILVVVIFAIILALII